MLLIQNILYIYTRKKGKDGKWVKSADCKSVASAM